MSTCAAVVLGPCLAAISWIIGCSVSFGKPTAVRRINQLPELLPARKWNGGRRRTVVSERTVRSNVNVLPIAEGNQIILQQQRMHFDLVHGLR